jgi:hypothetical protein
LGFDIKNKKAIFYDDDNKKVQTTALSDISKFTVETLKIPEARNSRISVAGATLSLNEYLEFLKELLVSIYFISLSHRF